MVTLSDFSSGKKQRNLPKQYSTSGRGASSNGPGPPSLNEPWYMFPFIDNYGSPDPFGGFPKPDINFIMPPGQDITALSSGTVTAVDNPAWGYAVTMQMDQPYNPIADHEAYIHLSSPSVSVGQHLSPGDQVGIGGGNDVPPGDQNASVGFAFYHGPDYGFGPTWSQYDGSSWLNPTNFINGVRANGPGGTSGGGTPGGGISFDPCSWPIFGWFCPGSSVNWTDILIRIVLVVSGAILVYIGASHLFEAGNMIPQTYSTEDNLGEATKGSNSNSSDDKSEESEESEEQPKAKPKEATQPVKTEKNTESV